MTDAPQGPGWWLAADLRWYPPELHPAYEQPPDPVALPPVGGYQLPELFGPPTPTMPALPPGFAPPTATSFRCPACGAANRPFATFCATCLTSLRVATGHETTAAGLGRGTPTPGEFTAIGATVVLCISVFLPWYTFSLDAGSSFLAPFATRSIGLLSSPAGGWRWLLFVGCLATVVTGLSKPIFDRLPNPVVSYRGLLGALAGLDCLLTVLAFALRPGFGLAGAILRLSVGWGAGAILGLVASLVAVAGLLTRRPR